MSSHYDKKGKVFTNRVTKDRVKVTVQMPTNQFSGYLHILPDQRTKDSLNDASGFLALTDGNLIDQTGKDGRAFDFAAINKDKIIWVIEEENREPEDTPGE